MFSDEVRVALVTAACIIGVATLLKSIAVKPDFIMLNSPSTYP